MMITNRELKKIENELFESGLNEDVRRKIRNSKICIIDDEISDLKSLFDGLKLEGFSNLKKFKKSPSINDILSEHYDIILLDLNGVAQDINAEDGLGVLNLIKQREPNLPILVITGKKIEPEVQDIINLADLVRKKPVLASDLANDVDTILKYHFDKYWASVMLLKELNKVDIELKKEINFFSRIKYHYYRKGLEKKLMSKEQDIITKLEKVYKIVKDTKSISRIIYNIGTNLLSND